MVDTLGNMDDTLDNMDDTLRNMDDSLGNMVNTLGNMDNSLGIMVNIMLAVFHFPRGFPGTHFRRVIWEPRLTECLSVPP